jgi:uncharacterized protein YdcH (DUF465 family)
LIRVANWANIFPTERTRQVIESKLPRGRSNITLPHLKGDFSDMELTNTDGLKDELIAMDPEFRELAREHGRYEQRLSELSSLQYPSDEEQLEEVTLKKKKLAVKDQMQAIMLKHQHSESTAH